VAQTLDCDFRSGSIRSKNWCRRGESNPRPRDYETLALPLSYAGIGNSLCYGFVCERVKELCPRTRCELPAKTLTRASVLLCWRVVKFCQDFAGIPVRVAAKPGGPLVL
jgi:hypothetical protein